MLDNFMPLVRPIEFLYDLSKMIQMSESWK